MSSPGLLAAFDAAAIRHRPASDLAGVDYRDLWPDAPLAQEQEQLEQLLDGTIDSFQFERRYVRRLRYSS